MPATNEWTHTLKSFKHSLKTLNSSNSPKSPEEKTCAPTLSLPWAAGRDQVKWTIPIHKIDKPSIVLPPSETTIVAPITEAVPMDEDTANERIEVTDWRT